MIPANVNTEAGWRNHWFIKNVLTELPIIGGFFHTSRKSDIIQSACKSTAMLVGGSTAMMLGMTTSKKSDDMDMGNGCNNNMALQMTKMAIGMSIGAVAYNGVYNAGRMCYQYHQFISTKKAMVASNTVQLEKQSPVTNSEPESVNATSPTSPTMSDSDPGFNPFSSNSEPKPVSATNPTMTDSKPEFNPFS